MKIEKSYIELKCELDFFCFIYNKYFDYIINADVDNYFNIYLLDSIKIQVSGLRRELNSNTYKRSFFELYFNYAQSGIDCESQLKDRYECFKKTVLDYIGDINIKTIEELGKVTFNKFKIMCNFPHHFRGTKMLNKSYDINIINSVNFELERKIEYYNSYIKENGI